MAIDITPQGDFCVRAADPKKGEGKGTRYEIIGTDRGFTVPKDASDAVIDAEKRKLFSNIPR